MLKRKKVNSKTNHETAKYVIPHLKLELYVVPRDLSRVWSPVWSPVYAVIARGSDSPGFGDIEALRRARIALLQWVIPCASVNIQNVNRI